MKTLKITLTIFLFAIGLTSCDKEIFFPPIDDTGPLCTAPISEADLAYIKEKIEAEPYKEPKFDRGINLTRNHCFVTSQVIEIIDLYVYRDDRLEMAKHLYHHTIDKDRYYDVVDQLDYKSDREELTKYIESH